MKRKTIIIANKIYTQYMNTNYYVRDNGDCYNVYRRSHTKGTLNSAGHLQVGDKTLIHQMVMHCYGSKKPELPNMVISHINGIKTDNRITNLEWLSKSKNVSQSMKRYFQISTNRKKQSDLKSKLHNEISWRERHSIKIKLYHERKANKLKTNSETGNNSNDSITDRNQIIESNTTNE